MSIFTHTLQLIESKYISLLGFPYEKRMNKNMWQNSTCQKHTKCKASKSVKWSICVYALRNLSYFISVSFMAIFISSCTTISIPKSPLLTSQNPESQWQNYQRILTTLTTWQVSGVVGVVMNQKGESANFIWKQNKNSFWIQIYGPLGLGATTFEGDTNTQEVTLKRSNGETVKAKSLQILMQSQLGWSIPIAGLYYWVRGLYIPNAAHILTLNEYGLIQNLQQQGWMIDYSRYMLFAHKYPLAEKMIFRYGEDLKITLIIKIWQLNP